MTDTTKLGKFEIRRELGKGAMGVVYEGYDPMIDRTVAIKTIRAENLQGEDAQEQLARFRREAQAAGKLTHPNVVSIYRVGELGTFTEKELALRPGDYIAVGRRRGFRDVRESFSVLPGVATDPVQVVCTEPI